MPFFGLLKQELYGKDLIEKVANISPEECVEYEKYFK